MQNLVDVVPFQYQILFVGIPLVDLIAIFTIPGLIIGWIVAIQAKKETARANTLSSLPVVTFEIAQGDRLLVKNIGDGAATNIKIDPYYHPIYDNLIEKKSYISKLIFSDIAILNKYTDKEVATVAKQTSAWGEDLLRFTMQYSKEKLVFSIRYGDLTGKRYIIRIQVHDGQIEIISAPQPFNLLQKIIFGYRWLNEQITLNFAAKRALKRLEQQK